MRTLRLSLAGTVILALLGGLGGAALAQDEASEPTTPAFFELVEETGDDDTWGIVTTDPRFSGTMVEDEPAIFSETPVAPEAPGIHAIGHGYDHVGWGLSRLENDEGAWQGWHAGFSWMQGAPWHEQSWFVGEGAYDGLSAVVASRCEQLPCGEGDTFLYGVIYEGDVPPIGPPVE